MVKNQSAGWWIYDYTQSYGLIARLRCKQSKGWSAPLSLKKELRRSHFPLRKEYGQGASSDTAPTATLLSAPQALSDIATEAEPPEAPSACGGAGRTDHYAAYLSIMGSTSDLSSDEEDLNQAIMASLESHAYVAHESNTVQLGSS